MKFIYNNNMMSQKRNINCFSKDTVKLFKKIALFPDNIQQMLNQKKKYPMKGIEHIFIKDEKTSYCKYCGYGIDNLMHGCRQTIKFPTFSINSVLVP